MKSTGLKHNRAKTAERILAAASSIFSEKGFAGARMDEIATRAGVNKATIYYHIGDKNALYAEVLHHVFKPTADRMAVNLRTGQGAEEKLVTFIQSFADMLDRHPHLSSIMLREVASDACRSSPPSSIKTPTQKCAPVACDQTTPRYSSSPPPSCSKPIPNQ